MPEKPAWVSTPTGWQRANGFVGAAKRPAIRATFVRYNREILLGVDFMIS
jgi:hypothetical protein